MQTFILLAAMAMTSTSVLAAHPDHGHLIFNQGALHAHVRWTQGPDAAGGESKMRLDWRDGSTHLPVEPAVTFGVYLWMPSMGHGSSPVQMQRVLNDKGQPVLGAYSVTNMYFIMPGDWEVRVKVSYQDGREETQAWPVTIGGHDGGHGGHH